MGRLRKRKILHQRFHRQNGMVLFGQEVHQIVHFGADGLISDHVHKVVDAVQLLGGGIDSGTDVILQFLGHPDDTLDTALSVDELLGRDEVTAMAHVTGGLNAAAGAGGQFAEGHAGRGHAGMTFGELASCTGGGVQTPGYMGHGRHFISSKKFIHAEGGIERIVWMPKELKDDVGPRVNATAKELYGIDNFMDMVADETVCTEVDDLMNFLTEKN